VVDCLAEHYAILDFECQGLDVQNLTPEQDAEFDKIYNSTYELIEQDQEALGKLVPKSGGELIQRK